MPTIQLQGDVNTAGGVAQNGAPSVRIQGRAVILVGNPVTPHSCCGQRGCPPVHCHATTSGGSPSFRIGGIAVIRTGDPDTCGHARAENSCSVRVD